MAEVFNTNLINVSAYYLELLKTPVTKTTLKQQLKLIFTASNDKDDKRGIAARHLLAINEKQDAYRTQQALDDWYLASKKTMMYLLLNIL